MHGSVMRPTDRVFAGEQSGPMQSDVREQIAAVLLDRLDIVTADTVAIFPYSGSETLDPQYCRRLGDLLAQLLAYAVRDGRLDARGGFVADLHRLVIERTLPMERL